MAGSSSFNDLRNEITSLLAENEELRQTVRLLRENQELQDALYNQSLDLSTLVPVQEPPRIDAPDPTARQPFMNIPTLERRDFVPEAAFRLDLRRQLDALAPLAVPSRARPPLAGAAAPAFTPERRQRSRIVFPEASPAGQCAVMFLHVDDFWPSA
ncbi:UNVERIFIED_CONTAM: hypothetical protein K2H54_001221 [Gekko kuhli]